MKAVVLAGGSGKRLWPVSRELYPKQFMSLDSNGSLLQQTVERARKHSEEIYVVTNEAQYYYVKHQLEAAYRELKGHYLVVIFEEQKDEIVVVTVLKVDDVRLNRYGFSRI